ncbi:hypothetical protein LEMLEM_LOCUS14632 [Lemmus lemmus]
MSISNSLQLQVLSPGQNCLSSKLKISRHGQNRWNQQPSCSGKGVRDTRHFHTTNTEQEQRDQLHQDVTSTQVSQSLLETKKS